MLALSSLFFADNPAASDAAKRALAGNAVLRSVFFLLGGRGRVVAFCLQ